VIIRFLSNFLKTYSNYQKKNLYFVHLAPPELRDLPMGISFQNSLAHLFSTKAHSLAHFFSSFPLKIVLEALSFFPYTHHQEELRDLKTLITKFLKYFFMDFLCFQQF